MEGRGPIYRWAPALRHRAVPSFDRWHHKGKQRVSRSGSLPPSSGPTPKARTTPRLAFRAVVGPGGEVELGVAL